MKNVVLDTLYVERNSPDLFCGFEKTNFHYMLNDMALVSKRSASIFSILYFAEYVEIADIC